MLVSALVSEMSGLWQVSCPACRCGSRAADGVIGVDDGVTRASHIHGVLSGTTAPSACLQAASPSSWQWPRAGASRLSGPGQPTLAPGTRRTQHSPVGSHTGRRLRAGATGLSLVTMPLGAIPDATFARNTAANPCSCVSGAACATGLDGRRGPWLMGYRYLGASRRGASTPRRMGNHPYPSASFARGASAWQA